MKDGTYDLHRATLASVRIIIFKTWSDTMSDQANVSSDMT